MIDRDTDEAARELVVQLPVLVDRRRAHALVEAIYDQTLELDRSTEPFVRPIPGHEAFLDESIDSDAPDLRGYAIKNR